jgi:hypothetical protein
MSGEDTTEDAAIDELASFEARLARSSHACLGLDATPSVPEICEAFAILATRLHPDRFSHLSEATRARARDCAVALREIFWALVDEVRGNQPVRTDDDLITLRLWRGVTKYSPP